MSKVSMAALEPNYHVRVYSLEDAERPEMDSEPELPGLEVLQHETVSDELAVLVLREVVTPAWIDQPGFEQVMYYLVVARWVAEHKLLLLHSSCRRESVYESLANWLSGAGQLSPAPNVAPVLNAIGAPQIINAGLRRNFHGAGAEAYRTLAGPNAVGAITLADRRMFHGGHAFGIEPFDDAAPEQARANIGYSPRSASVWANGRASLDGFRLWTGQVANNVASGDELASHTRWDEVSHGSRISVYDRDDCIGCLPPASVFARNPVLMLNESRCFLCDTQIKVVELAKGDPDVLLVLETPEFSIPITYSLATGRHRAAFHRGTPEQGPVDGLPDQRIVVRDGDTEISLFTFFNSAPPSLVFSDLSVSMGRLYFPFLSVAANSLPGGQFEELDWSQVNVRHEEFHEWEKDMRGANLKEFQSLDDINLSNYSGVADRSILGHFAYDLLRGTDDYEFVFCDQNKGEMADFIAIQSGENAVNVALYHCKALKGPADRRPGAQISDFDELVPQAIASVRDTAAFETIVRHIRKRLKSGQQFIVRGTLAILDEIATRALRLPVQRSVVLVQPALSKAGREQSKELTEQLAALNDLLWQEGLDDLRIICSP